LHWWNLRCSIFPGMEAEHRNVIFHLKTALTMASQTFSDVLYRRYGLQHQLDCTNTAHVLPFLYNFVWSCIQSLGKIDLISFTSSSTWIEIKSLYLVKIIHFQLNEAIVMKNLHCSFHRSVIPASHNEKSLNRRFDPRMLPSNELQSFNMQWLNKHTAKVSRSISAVLKTQIGEMNGHRKNQLHFFVKICLLMFFDFELGSIFSFWWKCFDIVFTLTQTKTLFSWSNLTVNLIFSLSLRQTPMLLLTASKNAQLRKCYSYKFHRVEWC